MGVAALSALSALFTRHNGLTKEDMQRAYRVDPDDGGCWERSDIFNLWQWPVQLLSSLQRNHYHWLQMQRHEHGKLIKNIFLIFS
jgi:hypothetical protein